VSLYTGILDTKVLYFKLQNNNLFNFHKQFLAKSGKDIGKLFAPKKDINFRKSTFSKPQFAFSKKPNPVARRNLRA